MKFTEGYFAFPIKIYDGSSLGKAQKLEDIIDIPTTADWIAGMVKLPGREFIENRIFWHDGFSRDRGVEEVASEGFDLTVVCTDLYGDFTCTWDRKKFEEKLNEFIAKYEASNPKERRDIESGRLDPIY